MRNAAVGGPGLSALQALNPTLGSVVIDGVSVACAEVQTQEPEFDAEDASSARRLLLRVRGFACSAADRGRLVAAAGFPGGSFYVMGSEFVADVVEVGREVRSVSPGTRVIGDNSWPGVAGAAWRGGIPTQHASREYLVLHEEKVIAIPPAMETADAAGFSVAAQTAYALVERVGAGPGTPVLLTAARSATSLFALDLLRRLGAEVYAATTSRGDDAWLRERGAHAVIHLHPGPDGGVEEELLEEAAAINGFECVLDPFFDLHLAHAVGVMAVGGRYVTCGRRGGAAGGHAAAAYGAALEVAVVKNLHLIGSSLGAREHLRRALDDHAAGELRVPVDSVWGGGRVAAFVHRACCDPERRGRAVYLYD